MISTALKLVSILIVLILAVACSDSVTEAPPPETSPPPTQTPVASEAPTASPSPTTTDRPTVSPTGVPAEPPPTEAPPTPAPTPAPTDAMPAEEERVLTLLYWQAPSLPGPYLASGYKDRDAGAVKGTLEPLAKYDPEGRLGSVDILLLRVIPGK